LGKARKGEGRQMGKMGQGERRRKWRDIGVTPEKLGRRKDGGNGGESGDKQL
jgi:hypothetical protein